MNEPADDSRVPMLNDDAPRTALGASGDGGGSGGGAMGVVPAAPARPARHLGGNVRVNMAMGALGTQAQQQRNNL